MKEKNCQKARDTLPLSTVHNNYLVQVWFSEQKPVPLKNIHIHAAASYEHLAS